MNVWRDRLQRWLEPLARKSPLGPNTISVIAVSLNVSAALSFYLAQTRAWLFLAGVGLLIVGGLCDAFDGMVARVREQTTRFGDFLDHSGDRVSDSLVVAGWMMGSGVRVELIVLALFLVMFLGYLGTQIEATFGVRSYEDVGRGEFVLGLIIYPLVSYILSRGGWSGLRPAGFTIAEWMTLLLSGMALFGAAQRVRRAARL